MVADILTKALARLKFSRCNRELMDTGVLVSDISTKY